MTAAEKSTPDFHSLAHCFVSVVFTVLETQQMVQWPIKKVEKHLQGLIWNTAI